MAVQFPKEPVAQPLPIFGRSIENVKRILKETPNIEQTESQEIVEELATVQTGDVAEGVKEATQLPPEAAQILKTGVSKVIARVNEKLELEGKKMTSVFKKNVP